MQAVRHCGTRRGALAIPLLACCVLGAPLAAQRPLHPELAVGVGIPTGSLGARYSAGLLLGAGVLIVDSARVWRLRLDGEVLRLHAKVAPNVFGSATGIYQSVGTMATLLVGPARHVVAPYVIAGLGIQQVRVSDVTYNRDGVVPALRVGGGMRANVRGVRVSLELSQHLVFSGRGTGGVPVLGGVSPAHRGSGVLACAQFDDPRRIPHQRLSIQHERGHGVAERLDGVRGPQNEWSRVSPRAHAERRMQATRSSFRPARRRRQDSCHAWQTTTAMP